MSTRAKVRSIVAAMGEESSEPRRSIPRGFEYDARAIKPLAKMLLSMSISLGHSLTAYREFTKLKSSRVSPDGMVGGRGYVMSIKDVRAKLQEACEILSSVSDTIHDEIHAPHWRPQLEELGTNDAEDVAALLDKSKEIMNDPEGYGEEEVDEVEEENDGPGGTPNDEPWVESEKKEDIASKLPSGGDAEVPPRATWKTASWWKAALTSEPADTTPGGPRVTTLDRADVPGGSWDPPNQEPRDDWGLGIREHEPLGVDVLAGDVWGQSALPSISGPVETGNDWGLGLWDSESKGPQYSETSRDGDGDWGECSDLPGSSGESGNPTATPGNPHPKHATIEWGVEGSSKLPGEGEPATRSDYYDGPRDNQYNVVLASMPWGEGPP